MTNILVTEKYEQICAERRAAEQEQYGSTMAVGATAVQAAFERPFYEQPLNLVLGRGWMVPTVGEILYSD